MFRPESKLIEEIVKDVKKKLKVLEEEEAAIIGAVIASNTFIGASVS